jgi:hypothetical protein
MKNGQKVITIKNRFTVLLQEGRCTGGNLGEISRTLEMGYLGTETQQKKLIFLVLMPIRVNRVLCMLTFKLLIKVKFVLFCHTFLIRLFGYINGVAAPSQ